MNKTFTELGYKVGDTVRCVDSDWEVYTLGNEYLLEAYKGIPTIDREHNGRSATWELVSRAGSTDTPDDEYLTWGDMTPEAKGALLLAEHDGVVIQEWNDGWKLWQFTDCSSRYNDTKYRVPPAVPVIVAYEVFGRPGFFWGSITDNRDTHKMTYNTIDGVIDCASVRMVELSAHTTE